MHFLLSFTFSGLASRYIVCLRSIHNEVTHLLFTSSMDIKSTSNTKSCKKDNDSENSACGKTKLLSI